MRRPAMAAATTGSGGLLNQPDGQREAWRPPTIEPIEMWRVQATTATNTTSTAASASGVRHRNAPTKLATALPPWNFRNTG